MPAWFDGSGLCHAADTLGFSTASQLGRHVKAVGETWRDKWKGKDFSFTFLTWK